MIQLRQSLSSLVFPRLPADDLKWYRLKNPDIQERFRDHIAGKLKKWSIAHPFGTYSPDPKRKNEELGIILLDLREPAT